MFFEFVVRIVQPFLSVRQWVQLRDTSKTMASLCTRIINTTREEDWMVLQQWLDNHVRSHCVANQGLRVEFLPSNEWCTMRSVGWKNHDTPYCIGRKWVPRKSKIKIVENLMFKSFLHETVPHGITDYSSHDCLVRVGNTIVPASVETTSYIRAVGGVCHQTLITIAKRTLRISLQNSRKRRRE